MHEYYEGILDHTTSGYLMQFFNSNIPHHVLVYSDESYISCCIDVGGNGWL